MRNKLSIALLTSCGLLAGCHAGSKHPVAATMSDTPESASTKPAFADCPVAETLVDRAGYALAARAKYRAQQVPDAVIIMVEGETPTPGYVVKLSMNPARIYPPQFTLYQKPPEGMVAQVMTPFDLCVKFAASNRDTIARVTIFDAEGRVEVPVQRALD